MDVLGIFAGVFQRWGPVYRYVEEFRVDRCDGGAFAGLSCAS